MVILHKWNLDKIDNRVLHSEISSSDHTTSNLPNLETFGNYCASETQ